MTTPGGDRNRRILVIDDNRAIHDDFRKILCGGDANGSNFEATEAALFGDTPAVETRSVFQITSAFQGQEGLATVEHGLQNNGRFAMAFVDVRMPPGWDGIETTMRIWKADPDIQIVICTAYSDYSWDDVIAKVGNSDRMVILKKPFDTVEVLQLAHALTEKWQLLQESRQRFADLEKLVDERARDLQSANASLEKEIREHKQAAEALRESEKRYEVLFKSNPLPMWVYDPENLHYTAVNETAIQNYGYSLEEFLAMTVKDLHPERDIPTLLDHLEQTREKPWAMTTWRHKKKDGAIIDVEVVSRLVALSGRRMKLVLAHDVTEKKRLQTQSLRTQRMEAIGTLATGMAHDLNNILAPVMMATEVLRWPLPPKDFEETIKRIENSARRGAEIINQVLAFGRGVEGKRALLPPRRLVDEVVMMISQTFPKTITITPRVAEDLWNIEGDRTQMQQVLLNLCVNARDAMPMGGTLSVEAKNVELDESDARQKPELKAGPYVVIRVADSGSGIPQEIIDRVFDPFFTTKAHGKGTGLGLSTALGIVKGHSGAITVSSEPQKGSVFEVLLPAFPGTSSFDTAIETKQEPIPRGNGDTILLVDDEAEILNANQKILERYNYKVVTAGDGAEGLAAFAHHRTAIKAIVTDIMMPQVDGFALIRAVKKLDETIPIIASSGLGKSLGRSGTKSELDSLHVEKFLMKPYSAEVLLHALDEVLHQSKPS